MSSPITPAAGSCVGYTSLPGGDPAIPGTCYSPAMAGLDFAAVLGVVLLVALATWAARFTRAREVGAGIETVITREGTYERPVA